MFLLVEDTFWSWSWEPWNPQNLVDRGAGEIIETGIEIVYLGVVFRFVGLDGKLCFDESRKCW